jgi:hypothetical protein
VDVLRFARSGQARTVLLFAAVHALLLRGVDHPLAASYPSLGGDAGVDPGAAFGDFIRRHDDELAELIATRNTQTNEVGRAAALLPAFALVSQESARPLGLVEVGASAGLNLLLDRFAYDYGQAHLGAGPVSISCQVRGDHAVPSPARMPVIAYRVGLDVEPIDVTDDDAVRWLRACVYADQVERAARLDAAIAVARTSPPRLVSADMVDGVGALLDDVPAGMTAVVYHSWALTYVARERRRAFVDALRAAASRRDEPLWWVAMEAGGVVAGAAEHEVQERPTLLTTARVDPDGQMALTVRAETHPHGRWVRWRGPTT